MARRIEIELTSARSDGTWTWRAAGALNPRGALDGALLYDGAKAGDVVRAEADFGMEGITVISVEPPRTEQPGDPNRIELLERPVNATVTTQLAARSRSSERRQGGRPGERLPRGDRPERGPRGEGGEGDRPRPDRGARTGRPTGGPGRQGAARPERQGHEGRPGAPGGAEGASGRERPQRGGDASRQNRRAPEGQRPQGSAPGRQRRLVVGNAHRNAMLEALPPEQRPIAQQLLRGGIPQVRTALFLEREKAREEGRPEPSTDGVLAIAESLIGRVKAAEWRDRADAAVKAGDDLSTRDLRLLVNGSDVARDEASRELVVQLREMLERRVESHREEWSRDVTRLLDEGHTLRAMRLSSRPPDPGARFSAELATRLREAAGAALASSVPADKWLAMLQAVSESPVRRAVKPSGLPDDPSPELLETARQQCGRVPGLAPLLGLSVPPPPPPSGRAPVAPRSNRGPGRGPRPAGPRAAGSTASSKAEASPETGAVGEAGGGPAPASEPGDATPAPSGTDAVGTDAVGTDAVGTGMGSAEPAGADSSAGTTEPAGEKELAEPRTSQTAAEAGPVDAAPEPADAPAADVAVEASPDPQA